MAEETWKVIFEESLGGVEGTTRPSPAVAASTKVQEEMLAETKKAAPTWANVGKFVGGLIGITSVIAFVFQMIRRSKVFSTFMDSFLTVFSAFIDIMMIPLIPVLGLALRWVIKFLPFAFEVQQKFADFMKDPWKTIKELLNKIPNAIEGLSKFLGSIFRGLGLEGVAKMFEGIGTKLGGASKEVIGLFTGAVDSIIKVWGTEGLTFWQKLIKTAEVSWNFIKESAKPIWNAIKDIWSSDILPFITGIWQGFYDNVLKPSWDKFITYVSPKMIEMWNGVIKTIGPEISKIWETVKSDLIKTWNDFKLTTLVPTWTVFVEDVKANFDYLIKDYLPKIWDWLMAVIAVAFDSKVIQPLVNTIKNILGYAGAGLVGAGAGAIVGGPVGALGGAMVGVGGMGLFKKIEEFFKKGQPISKGAIPPAPGFQLPGFEPRKLEPSELPTGYQLGSNFIPRDMLAFLHRGERVIPASENRSTTTNYNRPINISNIFNIAAEPTLLSRKIANTLDQEIKNGWILIR